MKVFAYYRVMCDDCIEKEHPEWLCRGGDGKLVLEPRTRRRPKPEERSHVICLNSPARELVQTRLLELADRGVDGIYFDSWHMPEVCFCANCRAAYQRETGKAMNAAAERGSDEYRLASEFVARTITRTFVQWKKAVKEKHPGVIFAIGSSLYPCFDTQMQITASLLEVSDTSKTEFSKPFGGHLAQASVRTGIEAAQRGRPFMDSSFALPSYDLQNALGWSFTRDSCDGRPPLMWMPFIQSEEESLFSTAGAVSYGCIASIMPTGLTARRATTVQMSAIETFKSSYALGDKVSPYLASTRPLRYAMIHVSERSRNARIADPRALWVELFAPILGAFEAFKEEHIPVATINDRQLSREISPQTRLIAVPHPSELSDEQRSMLSKFESAGGVVLPLDAARGWHLKSEEAKLKRELLDRVAQRAGTPPIRARGPAAMHAVFFRHPVTQANVVCLVNDFGWFRSERNTPEKSAAQAAPPPCSNVALELVGPSATVRRAIEAVTGKELAVRSENGKVVITVPDFPIMACVVVE